MRLITTLFFASALLCTAAEIPAGRWEGSIQIPGRELNVIVDLAQGETGAWIGSVIVPGLDIKGTPLADIVVKGSETDFAFKNALGGQVDEAKFRARVNEKGALVGDFLQGGNSAPFALEKTGPPQVELPAKSTAVVKELEGEWIGEYELLGYPRHVTIRLTNHAGGGATADFVVVGKKTNNLPVDLVIQQEDFIRIESHETGINYEGRFRKEGGVINGTLAQGPLEIPLVVHRAK